MARVKAARAPAGRFQITYNGDGLELVKPPADIHLYFPPDRAPLLAPARSDLDPAGRVELRRLLALQYAGGRGWADLCTLDGTPCGDEIRGAWLCLERSAAEGAPDLFVFELLGLEVREGAQAPVSGRVIDYLENGAQGIVVMETAEGEVLVPLLERFVEIRAEPRELWIPHWRDFVPDSAEDA